MYGWYFHPPHPSPPSSFSPPPFLGPPWEPTSGRSAPWGEVPDTGGRGSPQSSGTEEGRTGIDGAGHGGPLGGTGGIQPGAAGWEGKASQCHPGTGGTVSAVLNLLYSLTLYSP